ncbi:MAG: phosphatidylglycerophosphatase A [Campylobacter sp.]|nr:phosphatidylglycerophosphatase A [Campylobacter sp.]
MNKTEKLILTFFYTGLMPKAPGTWGSIAGALVGLVVLKFLTAETLFLLSILFFLIGINLVNKLESISGEHDNSFIVIDEVVGVWLAMAIAGASRGIDLFGTGGELSFSYLNILLCVIFFRGFDILKPSIIGKVDRDVKGGLGVMLDDVLAGGFAGLLALIVHGALVKLGFGHLYEFGI